MFSHCLVSIILSQPDQCLVTDWSVFSQSLISVNLVTVLSVLDTVCLSQSGPCFVTVWSVLCHSLVSINFNQSGQF